MKRQIAIFLAGTLVVVPVALTVYIVISAGAWLNGLGNRALSYWQVELPPGVGALVILAAIYLVGLLTRVWVFRSLGRLLERLVTRLPGVKTIYESIRDLMQLFGGDSERMGRSVLYCPPGSQTTILGILTNERPRGLGDDRQPGKVALYVPYSYMFGGVTVYVPRDHLREVDLPVEQALKLAATAQVSRAEGAEPPAKARPADETAAGKQD